jgi:hypothetical protein
MEGLASPTRRWYYCARRYVTGSAIGSNRNSDSKLRPKSKASVMPLARSQHAGLNQLGSLALILRTMLSLQPSMPSVAPPSRRMPGTNAPPARPNGRKTPSAAGPLARCFSKLASRSIFNRTRNEASRVGRPSTAARALQRPLIGMLSSAITPESQLRGCCSVGALAGSECLLHWRLCPLGLTSPAFSG